MNNYPLTSIAIWVLLTSLCQANQQKDQSNQQHELLRAFDKNTSSVVQAKRAQFVEDILGLKAPFKVIFADTYQDGGTSTFKVTDAKMRTIEFGVDGRAVGVRVKEDGEFVQEENTNGQLFLGGPHPTQGGQILPKNGKKEIALRILLAWWRDEHFAEEQQWFLRKLPPHGKRYDAASKMQLIGRQIICQFGSGFVTPNKKEEVAESEIYLEVVKEQLGKWDKWQRDLSTSILQIQKRLTDVKQRKNEAMQERLNTEIAERKGVAKEQIDAWLESCSGWDRAAERMRASQTPQVRQIGARLKKVSEEARETLKKFLRNLP